MFFSSYIWTRQNYYITHQIFSSVILHIGKDGKEGSSKDKSNVGQLAVPRLSVCADAQKVDRAKLAQTVSFIFPFLNYSAKINKKTLMLRFH